MAFEKITEEELASVGVENLPDRPALQPQEAKEKFEETAKKLLAPKINKLIEALIDATAAAAIGATVPADLPQETEKNVQAVLQAVLSKLMEHERKTNNPHNVKAEQTGAYTKEETKRAIDEKMQAIGAGDMAKSVYDKKNKSTDVFDYADEMANKVKFQFPVGYIFDWAPVEGQDVDLSTPEQVAEHFGYGTWKEITGRFTFGRDEDHEVGSTGGEQEHTLAAAEAPDHTHPLAVGQSGGSASFPAWAFTGAAGGPSHGFSANYALTGYTGSKARATEPHNNMPPYLTVYKWQRIA